MTHQDFFGAPTVETATVPDSVDLERYLLTSTQKLEALMQRVQDGEMVEPESHNWMLEQVDFIVETIRDDEGVLGDNLRSNLLQLLLAIANLNEEIRSSAAAQFPVQ